MKKILIIAGIIIIFIAMIIYSRYYVYNYHDKSFDISYDQKWNISKNSNNHFKLNNKNKSAIDIYIKDITIESNKSETYADLNNKFLKQNKNFKLINASDTVVGKEYYEAYELLYETKTTQMLYIIIITDNKIININYTALSKYFDIDLEGFYEVLNTLEIR